MLALSTLVAAGLAAIALDDSALSFPERRCDDPQPRLAQGAPSAPRRLDRLPMASHYLTLFRTVDGCLDPVIVRSDIGADRSTTPPR